MKKKTPPKISITYNKWDSEYFGKKIGDMRYSGPARISDAVASELIDKTVKKAASSKFNYLVFTFPQVRSFLRDPSEDNGFRLVDASVDFKLISRKTSSERKISDYIVVKARKEDMPEVEKIAVYSFKLSRLYKIKFVKKKLAGDYHAMWVRNLYKNKGSLMFVAKLNGKVRGFLAATINKKGRSLRIILVASARNSQGKGVASSLMSHVLGVAKEQCLNTIYVKTQKENIAASKLYEKNGFKINSEEYKYHKYI